MKFGVVLPSPSTLLIPFANPNKYTEKRATNLYWIPVMCTILNGSSSVQWKNNRSSNSVRSFLLCRGGNWVSGRSFNFCKVSYLLNQRVKNFVLFLTPNNPPERSFQDLAVLTRRMELKHLFLVLPAIFSVNPTQPRVIWKEGTWTGEVLHQIG